MVEHDLAKVGVASSSLVFRSKDRLVIDGLFCRNSTRWLLSKYYQTFTIFTQNMSIEYHPLKPFLPNEAKLLMLGSFPPKRNRWSMEFYYPNFQNDMWRIMGYLFYGDKYFFVNEDSQSFCREKIVDFCTEKGIALFDAAYAVRRLNDNASDKFLEVCSVTDIQMLLSEIPYCKAIVTTGQKATDIIVGVMKCVGPKVGEKINLIYNDRPMILYRMPSSSRAYPMAIDKKAVFYQKMFCELEIL